jgi:hypothetical protein
VDEGKEYFGVNQARGIQGRFRAQPGFAECLVPWWTARVEAG